MDKSLIFVSKSKTMKKKCENCKFWSFKASGDSDTSIGICLNEKTNEQVTMMSEGALARFFASGDSEWEKSENAKVIATSLRFRNDFSCENYEFRLREDDPHPDWNLGHVWSKFWAVERDGQEYWFEEKPFMFCPVRGIWLTDGGRSARGRVYKASRDFWKQSVQSRPAYWDKIAGFP